MNLFVTISITLLVILAALFYLLKVKNENHGPLYRWAGLLVLAAAFSLFLFLVFKGVKRLLRHDHRDYREMKVHKSGKSEHRKMKMNNGMHECCNHAACCCNDSGFREFSDSSRVQMESSVDTIDGKIIRKEIKIIKEEK